ARGPRAGLEDVDDEIPVVLAARHLVRRLDDRAGELGVELARVAVDLGGRLLDEGERPDHPARQPQPADREILGRTLRLGAVEGTAGNFHLPEGVGLDAAIGRHLPLYVQSLWMLRMAQDSSNSTA